MYVRPLQLELRRRPLALDYDALILSATVRQETPGTTPR